MQGLLLSATTNSRLDLRRRPCVSPLTTSGHRDRSRACNLADTCRSGKAGNRRSAPATLRRSGTLPDANQRRTEHGLRELRNRESRRQQVLRQLRQSARGHLPALRRAEPQRRTLLRQLRPDAGHRAPRRRPGRAPGLGRAAPGHRAVHRPRRLHVPRRGPRSRGRARAAEPLLRHRHRDRRRCTAGRWRSSSATR